eukprot:4551262-Alexandrium_andersonii.AAC.1
MPSRAGKPASPHRAPGSESIAGAAPGLLDGQAVGAPGPPEGVAKQESAPTQLRPWQTRGQEERSAELR